MSPIRSFKYRLGLTLLAVLIFLGSAGCEVKPPQDAVAGPEDPSVVSRATGYALIARGDGYGLLAVSLSDGSRRELVPDMRPESALHGVAGPDASGRIAYVESVKSPSEKFWLKVTSLDRDIARAVFERNGTTYRYDGIGVYLSLSAAGGNLAFVGAPLPSYFDPGEQDLPREKVLVGGRRRGPLEIWSIDAARPGRADVTAIDDGLAWLPDGRRLAYTTLLSRDQVAAEVPGEEVAGGFEARTQIPTVMILDVHTRKSTFLRVGWRPVISPDGEHVLVGNALGQAHLVSLKTRQAEPITLPGATRGGAIAFVGANLVLYRAFPTKGAPQTLTKSYSPLVGPRWNETLKIVDTKTGKFATVFAPLDPRSPVSFGRPTRQ